MPEEQVEEIEKEETSGEEGNSKPKFSLKSRSLMLVTTLVVAAIMLLVAIPGFFDNSALKFKIEQKISQTLNTNLRVKGNVDVSLFPYPSITLHDVLLNRYKNDEEIYGLHSESLQINLSITKFFHKEFSITKMIFIHPTLQTYYDENSSEPRSDKFNDLTTQFNQLQDNNNYEINSGSSFSSELFHVDTFDSSQFSANKLPKIEVIDGIMITYDKFSRKREIADIKGKAMIDASKIRAEGKFSSENIETTFKLNANFKSDSSENDSTIELHSSTMNLIIRGSFTSENRGIFTSDFNGKVDAEIFELRNFYRDYISSNTAIYAKLKPNSQSIKISSDIKNNAGEIALDNIIINSNLVNGKGGALIDLTSKLPRIDVTLNLDNLDLDNIWSNERVQIQAGKTYVGSDYESDETMESIKTTSPSASENNSAVNIPTPSETETKATDPKNTDLTKVITTNIEEINKNPKAKPESLNIRMASKIRNFELSAEIQAKEVKFLEGQIKNLDLYTTISKEGQILLLPIIFDIPGDGMVRLNGVLENNQDLPKFIGKIDVNGKNLGETFKWLNLQSQNLKFDNLKDYIVYSDVLLFPNNITLDNFYLNLNNEQSEFLGRINIDSSDKITKITNQFQVSTFNIDDFFLTSGRNVYLSQGSLLRKLLWLNDIASDNDITLNFEKLIYKGEEFSHEASLKMNFGQGYLRISDLRLTSEKTSLQASMSLDISAQNPLFNINIIADNLHYDSIAIAKTTTTENNNEDLKKISVADQFFTLPSLDGFGGSVNIVVNDLKLDNLDIQKSKLSGKLQDGNLNEAILECSLYGGDLKYNGLIGIKNDKALNGNITLVNATLDSLIPDLIGLRNIGGVANISANITAVAGSKAEFLKNINSEIKFNAAAPTIQGYGLADLVGKLFYYTNYRSELQNPEKIINNPESTTTFKQASGTINLDKDKGGKISINLSAQAINAVLSGKIDLPNNSVDGMINVIFVTGSRQKTIPLNVATAIKGEMSKPSTNSNLDQVRQYLGLASLNKPAPTSDTASATATNPIGTDPATQSSNSETSNNNSSVTQNSAITDQRTNSTKAMEDAQTQDALNKLKAVMANPNVAGQVLNQQPNDTSQ